MDQKRYSVRLENSHLYYNRKGSDLTVLENFSFDVQEGEIVAILGASGSGKSSLLRVLSGQQRLASGKLKVLDGDPMRAAQRGQVAIASHDAALLPWRTTQCNARLPLDLLGRPRHSSDHLVKPLLSRLRIEHVSEHRPAQLSEGQCQRLRLAQALSTAPQLLLLDEPFNNSDEALREKLTEIVLTFVREVERRSAILVTHFAREAAVMADRIIVMGGPPLRVIQEVVPDIPGPERRQGDNADRIVRDIRPYLQLAAADAVAGEGP